MNPVAALHESALGTARRFAAAPMFGRSRRYNGHTAGLSPRLPALTVVPVAAVDHAIGQHETALRLSVGDRPPEMQNVRRVRRQVYRISFRLGPREFDYLTPFRGLVRDELSEMGGRTGYYGAPQVREPCLYFGIGQSRIDLLVELLDNFVWCISGRGDPVPGACLITRQEIAQGRQLRQHLRARRAGHGQRAQRAGSNVLN